MARKQKKAAMNEGDDKGKSKATASQKETERKRREKVRNERNEAVLEHFEKTYGVDDVLQAWQQLLRDLGLPVETSKAKCKEVSTTNVLPLSVPGLTSPRLWRKTTSTSMTSSKLARAT